MAAAASEIAHLAGAGNSALGERPQGRGLGARRWLANWPAGREGDAGNVRLGLYPVRGPGGRSCPCCGGACRRVERGEALSGGSLHAISHRGRGRGRL